MTAGLLNYGGNMKPCHIGMGVVIGEEDDVGPLGVYGGVVRRRNDVFPAITFSDRER